jgi:hypothetical protein
MEPQEQKMSKEAKQTLIAFIIGILFVIAMFVWQPLMLRYHKKTCGFAFRAYTNEELIILIIAFKIRIIFGSQRVNLRAIIK